ncbi:MAG: hypothetical protein M1381_08010 [Deltaproteobacteria bacterium]|nr:hypothetical protein [Deltaproteobacteria bacterium]
MKFLMKYPDACTGISVIPKYVGIHSPDYLFRGNNDIDVLPRRKHRGNLLIIKL